MSRNDVPPAYGQVDDEALRELVEACGPGAVSSSEKDRKVYGRDKITEERYAGLADVVVFPSSTEEVVKIADIARRRRLPMTPRGGGSGLSGGAVPVYGGIVVAFERMNRILEIDEANLVAVVEPGVVTRELDAALEPRGLFFAGYPMSEEICQIGGNVAENAGGGRAVKYGVTGDYVLGLHVVTAGGDVLRFGGRRIKDVTGYDLISLFVGSEGTLGLITQITLRVLPRPTARAALLGFARTESSLGELVPLLLGKLPTRPSAIEMADATCLRLLRKASSQWGWVPEDASMLLVEFDGNDAGEVAAARDAAAELMEKNGVVEIRGSADRKEFDELWRIRKQIPWALMKMSPHQTMEDITVPVSQVWPLIRATRKMTEASGIEIANFGHLGDGNIHCTPIKPGDMPVDEWHDRLEELLPELYRVAAGLGGTISGEHGIGHKRRGYMPLVFSAAELEAFRAIKRALDPDGLMNPGKIV